MAKGLQLVLFLGTSSRGFQVRDCVCYDHLLERRVSPQRVGKAWTFHPGVKWEACHLEDFTLLWGNLISSMPTPQPGALACISAPQEYPCSQSPFHNPGEWEEGAVPGN